MERNRKKIEAAIKTGEIGNVRVEVLDIVENHAGKAAALDAVQYAVSSVPGLFETDDASVVFLPREMWNKQYAARLADAVRENFSREKLSQFLEVKSAFSRNPGEFKNRSDESELEGNPIAEPEDSDVGWASRRTCPSKSARIIGYIIMALSLAAVIVAICIPIKWLIGVGIGVFMISTILVYFNIKE